MKRTINEIHQLIKEKYQNANDDLTGEYLKAYPDYNKILKLQGEIAAYHDVIILMETSDVLSEN